MKRSWVKEHGGSSKATVSGLAVDILISGTTEKARILTIIIDEHSKIMVKIKKSLPHEVTNECDINHAKKNVGSDLYALKKKHHILSSQVIS